MRTLCSLLVLASGACGRMIEVRTESVSRSEALELLQGQWVGEWRSDRTGAGSVSIDVQDFAGQPLVSVRLVNPCTLPGNYQIFLDGTVFELRRDGESVLRAGLRSADELEGTYVCALDGGTWRATRTGELPEIVDLGGSWLGSVRSVVGEQPIVLTLSQSVSSGELVLAGTLELPGLVVDALPIVGAVRFREGAFDLELGTAQGVAPRATLFGSGDPESRSIPTGVVQVGVDPRIPFRSGSFQAVRTGP